ncbi:VOC family protein, partial [Candidatus Bipolaricaulota bacterium]|nr:VOC family protein [Candidatus Bipolaricaulota bacterium]
MTNSIEAARIEWIVIPAPDLQTAETFYREVFGFTITPYSETYLVFKAG